MDWRLKEGNGITKWLEDNFGTKYDEITIAGGAKDLVSPNSSAYTIHLLDGVEISYSLHGVRKIILNNHTECGAYLKTNTFANAEEERKKLIDDLQTAAKLIIQKYPDIEVILVLSTVSGVTTIGHEIIQQEI